VTDETFLLLLNASHLDVNFTLPALAGGRWKTVIDTVDEKGFPDPQPEHEPGAVLPMAPRSVMLLSRPH
jgi:glycogen operon protein